MERRRDYCTTPPAARRRSSTKPSRSIARACLSGRRSRKLGWTVTSRYLSSRGRNIPRNGARVCRFPLSAWSAVAPSATTTVGSTSRTSSAQPPAIMLDVARVGLAVKAALTARRELEALHRIRTATGLRDRRRLVEVARHNDGVSSDYGFAAQGRATRPARCVDPTGKIGKAGLRDGHASTRFPGRTARNAVKVGGSDMNDVS